MRGIPVEDDWVQPGQTRRVLAGPDGDLTSDVIAPLEVVLDPSGGYLTMWSFWLLDPEERADIAAGGLVMLGVHGEFHPPVSVNVAVTSGHGGEGPEPVDVPAAVRVVAPLAVAAQDVRASTNRQTTALVFPRHLLPGVKMINGFPIIRADIPAPLLGVLP